jgi:16S rRNA (cytosine1402-N4)-methyltransferase
MAREVVELFRPLTEGVIVDATFGGGGHSRALLESLAQGIEILGIDRDPEALERAFSHDRLTVVRGNFGELDVIVNEAGIGNIVGALFDFGVSSHQLDEPARGFSYRHDGPIDMRMGPDAATDAGTIVNEADHRTLSRIIYRFGDEKFAQRIATAIIAARPITTTGRLAEIVKQAIPAAARRTGGHPATKTFQALRIAVNDEMAAIGSGVAGALNLLSIGGRCATIAYHSLEDRIVKKAFREGAGRVDVGRLPIEPEVTLKELTRKPIWASEAEIESNPRARSARLRAVEKVA